MSLSKEKARENLAKLVEKFEKEFSSVRANELYDKQRDIRLGNNLH